MANGPLKKLIITVDLTKEAGKQGGILEADFLHGSLVSKISEVLGLPHGDEFKAGGAFNTKITYWPVPAPKQGSKALATWIRKKRRAAR
jgi:hypothetical protein